MNSMLWLGLFVFLPTAAFTFYAWKTVLKYNSLIFISVALLLVIGFVWDYMSVSFGVWFFAPGTLAILGLPVEEWLFISLSSYLMSLVTVFLWERWGIYD